jgi:hypothetical protein
VDDYLASVTVVEGDEDRTERQPENPLSRRAKKICVSSVSEA